MNKINIRFSRTLILMLTLIFLLSSCSNSTIAEVSITETPIPDANEFNLVDMDDLIENGRKLLEDMDPEHINFIGLGEAAHGVHEFSVIKSELIKILIEDYQYKTIFIEANYGSTSAINTYIKHGQGNASDAIKNTESWSFATEEFLELIEWIRQYNIDKDESQQIEVHGIDVQSVNIIENRISEILEKTDSELIEFYDDKKSLFKKTYTSRDETDAFISELEKRIYEYEEELLTNISKYEMKELLKGIDMIKTFYEYKDVEYEMRQTSDDEKKASLTNKLIDIRESHMFENIQFLHSSRFEQYGFERSIIWAHNGHVAKQFREYESIGKKMIDKDTSYKSIAFDFYKGSTVSYGYDGSGIKLGIINLPDGNEIEDVEVNRFIFKRNTMVNNFVASNNVFFKEKKVFHIRHYGATVVENNNFEPYNIVDSFDALIYIHEVSPCTFISENFKELAPIPERTFKSFNR